MGNCCQKDVYNEETKEGSRLGGIENEDAFYDIDGNCYTWDDNERHVIFVKQFSPETEFCKQTFRLFLGF